MEQTESGLQYEFVKKGEGRIPQSGDTVTLHFSGWLSDGTLLESSYDTEPFSFMVQRAEVIRAWDEGVMLMPEGSVMRLVAPPHLGFGEAGTKDVPPNSTLNFELQLLSIRPLG